MYKVNRVYVLLIIFVTALGTLIVFNRPAPAATSPDQNSEAQGPSVQVDDTLVYLPFISTPLLPPTLTINTTSFIHDGMYSVIWSSVDSVTAYMLVEDDNPQFTSPETMYEGAELFWAGTGKPCGIPVYYRVRGTAGAQGGTNWSDPVSVTPQIEFTYVPPKGSTTNLEGKVCSVDPANYNVAVYIYIHGQWWTKPYWNQPWTSIKSDNTWQADITTGGDDPQASRIAAFLVPKSVPSVLCGSSHGSCFPLPQVPYPHVIISR
jgi:hypothetical protein